jgi:tetratricopeptide (TPR) repeat protein
VDWSVQDCEILLEKNPMHAMARYRLAELWIKNGEKLDEAKRLLDVVVKSEPELNKGQIQLLLGDREYCGKKYNEALEHYAAASEVNPYSVEVMIKMGLCYEKMREFDDAIRCFKKGLRRDKTSFLATYRLGCVYIRNNQKDKGLAKLQEAYAMNPEDLSLL